MKALGVADSGDDMDTGAPVGFQRGGEPPVDTAQVIIDILHQKLIAARPAITNDHIHCCESGNRFPQRARGQTLAVAKTSDAIDDRNFQVAMHRQMLQTIIKKQYVTIGMFEQLCGGLVTICRDCDRTPGALRNQDRFITDLGRMTVGSHLLGTSRMSPPITPADHAGPVSLRGEKMAQPDNQWCLAGATDSNIANHDNRDIHTAPGQDPQCIGHISQLHHPRIQPTGRQ